MRLRSCASQLGYPIRTFSTKTLVRQALQVGELWAMQFCASIR
jgi:hypothetical protein